MNRFRTINLSGSLLLGKEEFAWRFENGQGTFISYDSQRILNTIDDAEIIRLIPGKYRELYNVYFVDCKIRKGLNISFIPKAIIFFEQDVVCERFDALKLEGSFLNDFYDPIKNTFVGPDIRKGINEFSTGNVEYKIKPYEETDINFESYYGDNKLELSFNTMRILDALSKKRFDRDINTVFYSKFDKPQTINTMINLYETLVLFFRLLLFSNSFSFNKLILCIRDNESKLKKVGELIVDSNYLNNENVSGKFQDLVQFKDKLSNYFQIVVKRTEENDTESNMSVDSFVGNTIEVNPSFYFANSKDIINTAMSFEHYYDRLYTSKNKGVTKTDFEVSLNHSLVHFIDKLLEEKEVINKKEYYIIRGKNRDLAKKYKNGVQRFDTSLENRIKHVRDKFPTLFEKICFKYAVDWKNTEIGKIPFYFSDFRNKLLHGKYVQMTNSVNTSYAVIRVLTYALLLTEAGFTEDEIIGIFNNFYKIYLDI